MNPDQVKDYATSLSISRRVHSGKCLTACEAILYLMAYTALTIATGIFLWHPREGDSKMKGYMVCNDHYTVVPLPSGGNYYKSDSNPCTNTVDVWYRFTTVLQLYFAFFVTQWFRTILIFVALCLNKPKLLVWTFEGLGCLQCLYGIAILIILHVYRFEPSGKIVSGDFMTSEQHKQIREAYFKKWDETGEMPESGQYIRGHFLFGLVIWVWIGGFFLSCVSFIIAIIHKRVYSSRNNNK